MELKIDSVKKMAESDRGDSTVQTQTLSIQFRMEKLVKKVLEWKGNASSTEHGWNERLKSLEKEAEEILSCLLDLLKSEASTVLAEKLIQRLFSNLFVIIREPPSILEYRREYDITVRLLLGRNFLSYFHLKENSELSVRAFCLKGNPNILLEDFEFSSAHLIGASCFKMTESEGLTSNVKFCITPKMIRGTRKAENELSEPSQISSFQICFAVISDFNAKGDGLLSAFTTTVPLRAKISEFDATSTKPNNISVPSGNSRSVCSAAEERIWKNAAKSTNEKTSSPDSLPFQRVNEVIAAKFLVITGRRLAEKDMDFVQQKFFRPDYLNDLKEQKLPLLRKEFMKAILLPEMKTPVTYWGWFSQLAVFINEHLCFSRRGGGVNSLWKEGFILGYVEPNNVPVLLNDSPSGTFLCRFSNSIPNAVTIDWKESCGIYSYRGSSTELKLRNLVDRILDIKRWKYMHPNIEKESLFLKYATDSKSSQLPATTSCGLIGFSNKSHLRSTLILNS